VKRLGDRPALAAGGMGATTTALRRCIEARHTVWHGIELRHLLALEAVAAERSFSAAAARLGYSQPAISGQIDALERIVGARLFVRTRGSRPLELTAEGASLLEHAHAIMGRLAVAREHLETLRRSAGTAC
jgi:DNA-binding transcriptional LysR family regulator